MTTSTIVDTKKNSNDSVDKTEDRIANVWVVAAKVLWDADKLAAGIIDLMDLRRPGSSVLDAACGTGMPGIALNKAGVRCSMSDGSATMVERARVGCEDELGSSEDIDMRVSYWNELHKTWGEKAFDNILVRGNSFPYVLNWDSAEGNGAPAPAALRTAYVSLMDSMRSIKKTLTPGGKLYFDTSSNCENPSDALCWEKKLRVSDDQSIIVRWVGRADPVKSTRMWSNEMTILDEHDNVTNYLKSEIYGALTGEVQLRAALLYSGFTDFKRVYTVGEGIYVPYMAHLDSEAGTHERAVNAAKAIWNEDGSISYGLHKDVYPAPFSTSVTALADDSPSAEINGTENGHVNKDEGGALVGPNRALRAWLNEKVDAVLGAKNVTSILNLGCGTGRTTLDLVRSFRDTVRYALGIDSSALNIRGARRLATDEVSRSGIPVEFHNGTLDTVPDERKFSVAFSECTLMEELPEAEQRRSALKSVYDALEEGGVFMLNDRVAGQNLHAPRVQLHYYERLGLHEPWSAEQMIDELKQVGFKLVEFVDLTKQQAASYKKLSKRAAKLAAEAEEGSTQHGTMRTYQNDYEISAIGASNNETGWAQFVCRK